MKLLILTPRFPYPVIGGDRLRIYQVCLALSKVFSLTLLSLCETKAEMDMPLPDDGVFQQVERVLLPRHVSYFNVLTSLFGSTPLQVAYYKSSIFANEIKRLLPEHDAVLCHLIRTADYVKSEKMLRFIEMTDAISLNYDRVKKIKTIGGFRSIIYQFESKRVRSYECDVIENFDLSILVSSTDLEYLVDGPHPKVIVCSNGVDFKKLPFKERSKSNPVIVYIGNMASLQNMDACLFFAKEVLPLINQRVKATFRVVGRISEADAAKLLSFDNIEVTGSVDDIAAVVEDARVGVCPVRLAAGVQNKVLEYMALGLPVVTSSIGLEGFAAQPDRDLLVADTPDEYAIAISRIWDDELLLKKFSRNGYLYVKAQHQWSNQLAPMVERMSALLENKQKDI